MKLDSYTLPCTEQFKIIKGLNIRLETLKRLEENVYIGISKGFLQRTPVAQEAIVNTGKWAYMKRNGFCTTKEVSDGAFYRKEAHLC